MKKIMLFLGVIVVLFAGVAYLTNQQNEEKTKESNNPYGDKKLYPETIAQLDDPNYQTIITMENLEKKLSAGEDVTVYFYSPTCPHCKKATPILMPLAKDMNIEIDQLNVLEYEQAWDIFKIEGTPTLIRFEDGRETARVTGGRDKQEYQDWLDEHVSKK
ncbi:thioredoxin family protein [Bacillus sp. B-jedd]|uniref:thioredoxin family protein n=1 Tax=Bacillus sp. B-jedd TaxID=1476857 RepID=UPI0005157189|nr:thioredoxin family protein [Bacillus sp. B-jedd]CEG29740.1 Thioredoxin domain-containing protein [Bacillus sp. B-jedd]